jgi:hypothetical protein
MIKLSRFYVIQKQSLAISQRHGFERAMQARFIGGRLFMKQNGHTITYCRASNNAVPI